MFRRDAFLLIGLALVGSAMAVYASLAETSFFPASLRTTLGDCPETRYTPGHRRPILTLDEASWYGSRLRALHEEPLTHGDVGGPRTFRFTLLSYPSATTVRLIETDKGRLHLTAKWLTPCSGNGGCVVEKLLSPAEQAQVEAAVAPFLTVPVYGCNGPVDSSSSILEMKDGDSYRLWHQRSGPNGDMAEVGILLLQLAEWPIAHELSVPPASRS